MREVINAFLSSLSYLISRAPAVDDNDDDSDFQDIADPGKDPTPEQLEAAAAKKLEEAEREQRTREANARSAARKAEADILKDRLGKLAVEGIERAKPLLRGASRDAVQEEVQTADFAVSAVLNASPDLNPDDFTSLKIEAETALTDAEKALKALAEKLDAEPARREKLLEQHAGPAKAIAEAVAQLPSGYATAPKAPPSAKKLPKLISDHEALLNSLRAHALTDPDDEFDSASKSAIDAGQLLLKQIAAVKSLLESRVAAGAKEAREQAAAKLRWTPAAPFSKDELGVLAGSDLVAALARDTKAHAESFKLLLELARENEPEQFNRQLEQTQLALSAIDKTHDLARKALDAEISQRDQRRRALQVELEDIENPKFGALPIDGSDDHAALLKARQAARQAVSALFQPLKTATPEAYSALLVTAQAKVREAFAVRERTAKTADLQRAAVQQLKDDLAVLAASARAGLPKGPSAEIADAAAKAFERSVSDAEGRIDGKKPDSDKAIVVAFEEDKKHVESLGLKLAALDAVAFARVQNNVSVRQCCDTLIATLAKQGICESAGLDALALTKKVRKVAEQYVEIDELQVWKKDVTGHSEFQHNWKSEVSALEARLAKIDDLETGALSNLINDCKDKFTELDERILSRQRGAQYLAEYKQTEEWKVLNIWVKKGPAAAIAKLTELVKNKTATMGDIKSCYISSYDDMSKKEFSVEVSVDIEGRHGIVVHAHCHKNGAPKTEYNASHIKKANNKRDQGGTAALNQDLFAALLPDKGEILRACDTKWEAPPARYDYDY